MNLPLAGVKVLDISRVVAGPYCTMLLGDLGAEIIKVEMPVKGDETRAWGPPFVEGESTYYLSINRNKKSITVDMKSEKGREILLKLAAECDVIIENFLPGTTKRLGLDYESVRKVKPDIIYCSISGFGQDGPFQSFPAFDLMMQGIGGLMSLTGEEDGNPVRIGVALIDLGAAMYAALGILSALLVKKESGQGQYVDVSLLDTEVSWLTYVAAAYLANGQMPKRMGTAHPSIVPYQAYKARDKYFILAVGNDAIWQRFCKGMNFDFADDPKFATNVMRVKHRDELNAILNDTFAQKDVAEWLKILEEAKVPCGPVNDISEVVNHPQVKHRNMIVELEHPKAGSVKVPGSPIKLSLTPPEYKLHPPQLGEHAGEILISLGYSEQEIVTMKEEGVI